MVEKMWNYWNKCKYFKQRKEYGIKGDNSYILVLLLQWEFYKIKKPLFFVQTSNYALNLNQNNISSMYEGHLETNAILTISWPKGNSFQNWLLCLFKLFFLYMYNQLK